MLTNMLNDGVTWPEAVIMLGFFGLIAFGLVCVLYLLTG